MAGPSPPYYTPISKPSPAYNPWKRIRINLFPFALIAFLCVFSYLIGAWQHGGGSGSTVSSTTSILGATVPCIILPKNNTPDADTVPSSTASKSLDFTSHHSADGGAVATVSQGAIKSFPTCDVKYSEYTPCEDPKRSLKFPRDRLIYRERHCPGKKELLKCRIPAPHGYKSPFKWPSSRDLAWYANVPHIELTVEKAVQNWIRYEGDRFRFPGGGTMFPNGADAYIDDIGKLINLKDGSIRTAIDTGCGVSYIL